MNLSDNLKKLRKEHNLSQEALAEILGVSRQSVSKWESGGAYPEMDKVLQICEYFNLSIDELMHEDVKNINESKNAKSNVNKIIDDFLNFITKSINLFTALKFKDKCKCLIEQGFIILTLTCIMAILYNIFSSCLRNIFAPISGRFIYAIIGAFDAVFILAAVILCFIIWLKVFKTRYLDYYEIVKVEKSSEESSEKIYAQNKETIKNENISTPKIEIPKEPQVIIRDERHSSYPFFHAISKIVLFFAKVIMGFIALGFMFILLMWGIMLVLTFMFKLNTLLFVGSFLTILSCTIITFVFLKFMYNFIFNTKSRKGIWGIVLGVSVITCGIGIGLFLIDITKVDILEDTEFVTEEKSYPMSPDLVIGAYLNNESFSYVPSDNEDVKIVIEYSKYASSHIYENSEVYDDRTLNLVNISTYIKDENIFKILRKSIQDLNDYKVYNYSGSKITIYTTEENIDILMKNYQEYDKLTHRYSYYYYYVEDENRGYITIDPPEIIIEEESF